MLVLCRVLLKLVLVCNVTCMLTQYGSRCIQDSFRDVGASEEIVKALRGIGIERPSFIQAAAYQALMSSGRHVILADHAGECCALMLCKKAS